MKTSQQFAAFRQSLITDLQHAITSELVPEFNARCEDIRRLAAEDFKKFQNQAKADNYKKTLTYDLVQHRKTVLDKVQEDLDKRIHEKLVQLGASLKQEEQPDPKKEGKMRMTTTAIFPDKSSARVPSALWIDYDQFDRV